jgi:hypothetical protein
LLCAIREALVNCRHRPFFLSFFPSFSMCSLLDERGPKEK